MKKKLPYLLLVIVAFLLGWFACSHHQKFVFSPDVVVVKKSIPIEVIQDVARLEQIIHTKEIVDYNYATLGAGLRLQEGKLFLIKSRDLEQEYHLEAKINLTAPTNFKPQYIGQRYPVPVMLVKTQQEVDLVKKTPAIYKYKEAQIGAVISLSLDKEYLNLIPKTIVEKDYELPIELRTYLKNPVRIN